MASKFKLGVRVKGKPNTDDEGRIDEFYKIRNYLAHYNDYAKRGVEKIYKQRYGLKTFRQPGEFLLTIDKREKETRMAVYISNFYEASEAMAKSIGVQT